MKIEIFKGDITTLKIDAIVNAANKSLLGGGGVDGAIHKAAGPDLLAECRTLNGCETGEAKITNAYKLKCKYIIHTVGPVWSGGKYDEDQLLKSCYKKCIKLADKHKIRSIAFPNIRTGVYRYPKNEAADIAIKTVKKYLQKCKYLNEVVFCVFDDENLKLYRELLK
jgi:O-acetyl-ADP-ribose deacetylase (regulator of RNase III)